MNEWSLDTPHSQYTFLLQEGDGAHTQGWGKLVVVKTTGDTTRRCDCAGSYRLQEARGTESKLKIQFMRTLSMCGLTAEDLFDENDKGDEAAAFVLESIAHGKTIGFRVGSVFFSLCCGDGNQETMRMFDGLVMDGEEPVAECWTQLVFV